MSVRSPGGAAAPVSAELAPGAVIDLEPLALEICRRYSAEFPDEDERYGAAGRDWCVHDNLYLLAWAAEDVRHGWAHFPGNVDWLRRVLASRGFPTERLARDLELAGEVVAQRLPTFADSLVERFEAAAATVRAETPAAAPPASAPVRDAYVRALLAAQPASARMVIEAALASGLPVRDVYLDVLEPALDEVGRLWEIGEASIAQEHLATATTEALLHELSGALPPPTPTGRSAIVSGTEGELHAVGARFVADFLGADGWNVIELGASTPTEDLVRLVDRVGPDLVALSTTLTSNLTKAATAVAALAALPRPPLIAVGGGGYRGDPDVARDIGADLFAADAGTFADELRKRLAAGTLR